MSQYLLIRENSLILYLYFLLLCGCSLPPMSKAMDLESLTAPNNTHASSRETIHATGGTQLRLSFSSGDWQSTSWNHELVTVLPAQTHCDKTAILLISNNSEAEKHLPILQEWSAKTGCPSATLTQIPNQPFFGKTEGALMAYSFSNYLTSQNPSWPLLIPMTRAIRTALTVLHRELPANPSKFILVGSSKRAWAGYLSAASDSRVVGLAGLAFNALNFTAQFKAMREAGGSPDELNTYKALGLLTDQPSESLGALYKLIDPYSYRTKLSLPIFVISGTNDNYWAIDAWRHFLSDLPSANSLMLPNTGHDPLDNPITRESLSTWLAHVANNTPFDKTDCDISRWYSEPSSPEERRGTWSQSRPKTAEKYMELEIQDCRTRFGRLSYSMVPKLKQECEFQTETDK